MSVEPVKILLVEDDEDDYLLTTDLLADIEQFKYDLTWAPKFEDGVARLREGVYDICLVDFRIGGRTGLDFVQEARELGCRAPVVFLTGMGDREMDIAAMEAGASDFLQKSELTSATLDRAIRYSINQARDRKFLEERTVLLQATLDNTGAGIGAIDQDGCLVTWNDRFVSVLEKLAADRAEGSGLPPELSGFRLCERFPMLQSSCEELECVDGTILSINRNNIAEGGAVIVCHDTTQQKQTEHALRHAKQHAEEANRAKSAFFANISHELRTPLNAIIGFADLIVGQSQGPIGCPDYEGYVGFIRESGTSLLGLINKTIDLARIEAADYPLERGEINVADSLGAALRLVEAVANERKVRVTADLAVPELAAFGDETAVSKIFSELLSNAVKFSEEGGSVIVSGAYDGAMTVLRVTDRGIGMEQAEIDRALSPFAQVDQKLARQYEGAGLGLPLAKALVEIHNGSLSIDSQRHAGTTITVVLPTHASAAASPKSSTPQPVPLTT